MLRQRLITSVIGFPILIAAAWFGNPWFSVLIATAAGLGIWEFYSMAKASRKRPLLYFGFVWTLLFAISANFPSSNTVPILMSSAVVFPLAYLVFRNPSDEAFSTWAWTITGILYVGWMLSYWVSLRLLQDGRAWVFWALFITFASDSGAYGAGRAFGKHKMAPVISPKKTWEGAAGGLVSSMAASVILAYLLLPQVDSWQAALLGAAGSVLAQLGDLVGSLLKRNFGAKDSGRILPGHGGMLDRTCSLSFIGVFVYYGVLTQQGIFF